MKRITKLVFILALMPTLAIGQTLSSVDVAALKSFIAKAEGRNAPETFDTIRPGRRPGVVAVVEGTTHCLVDTLTHKVVSWSTMPVMPERSAVPMGEQEAVSNAKAWLQKMGYGSQGSPIKATLSQAGWVIRFPRFINNYESTSFITVALNSSTGKVWDFQSVGFEFTSDPPVVEVQPEDAVHIVRARYSSVIGSSPTRVQYIKTSYSAGGPSFLDKRDTRPLVDQRRHRLGHQISFDGPGGSGIAVVDAESGELLLDGLFKVSDRNLASSGVESVAATSPTTQPTLSERKATMRMNDSRVGTPPEVAFFRGTLICLGLGLAFWLGRKWKR